MRSALASTLQQFSVHARGTSRPGIRAVVGEQERSSHSRSRRTRQTQYVVVVVGAVAVAGGGGCGGTSADVVGMVVVVVSPFGL